MAATLTLTPNTSGGVSQALNDRNPFTVAQEGFSLPTPQYDEEYAESIDTEGGRRVRSRPQNPTGKIPLQVRGANIAAVWTALSNLQQTVETCRRYGGVLAYTPTGGTAVSYDLESIHISDLPQDELTFSRARPVLEFVARPYGRLTPVTIAAAATSSDPIQSVPLLDIPGSVDALIEATITDVAAQARDHLEVGLDDDLPAQAAYSTAVLADTPALYWRLGASGTTDQSGNARNGTGAGGITIGGQSPGALVGDTDAATDFDGTDDRITSSYAPFTAGSTITVEGWAWRDTSSGADVLFGTSSGSTPTWLYIASGSQNVVFSPDNTALTTWTSAWPGNAQWVHWAFTFNETSNNASLYINGVLVSTQTQATNYSTPGNFAIGTRAGTFDPFDGKMDEVAVYTSALSATRIRAHYLIGRGNYTTPFLIDSKELTASGLAGTSSTRTGAYLDSSNNVYRATLATVPVGVCEATGLNHRSRQRVKARVYASGTGPYYARVAFRIGSGPWTRGSWVTCLDDVFNEIELGIVSPNPDVGTLTVRIEAYTSTPGDTFDVDYILLIPTSKYAKARCPFDGIPYSPVFSASDAFNQTAGALNAKTADLGGAWTTSGSATDLAVVAGSSHNLQRSTTSDASPRFAVIGSAAGSQAVSVLESASGLVSATPTVQLGVVARFVDSSNYLVATWRPYATPYVITVDEVLAGVTTNLYTGSAPGIGQNSQVVLAVAGGNWIFGFANGSNVPVVVSSGYRASLDTGALASGKVGIFDYSTSSSAVTRVYDNFAAWVPDVQHVTAASGAVIIDHESIARSDGTRPSEFEGSYLRSAPEGREGRTARMVVKLRRTDVDTTPDTQIADAQQVSVSATPRVALV